MLQKILFTLCKVNDMAHAGADKREVMFKKDFNPGAYPIFLSLTRFTLEGFANHPITCWLGACYTRSAENDTLGVDQETGLVGFLQNFYKIIPHLVQEFTGIYLSNYFHLTANIFNEKSVYCIVFYCMARCERAGQL